MPGSFNSDFITQKLASLTQRHWVTFAATCAERLLPHYAEFQQSVGWGDADLLRQALDEAWHWSSGASVTPQRFQELERQCYAVMPDTEDFSTLLCSRALDASVAVCETLQLCMGADLSHAINAASAARDTVDMFIQERDQMEYDDPQFEQKILADQLMVREVSNQRLVLDELSSLTELDVAFVTALRRRFVGQSNIR